MKTQKHLFFCFSLLCLFAITITGCNDKKQGKSGKQNDISFDSIQVDQNYYLLNNTSYPHCELKLNFVYPVKASSPEILTAVQQEFIKIFFGEEAEGTNPKEAIELFKEDYLKEYMSLEKPFLEDLKNNPDAPAWYNYTEFRYNEINYNKNSLLSYSSYRESFTGGAHGSHALVNQVLDLRTGKPVSEQDIFVEGYQGPLTAILIQHIAEENDLTEPKDLEDIGYFSIDEIYPNNNFLVDDSGITYDFNEYEIAAYVIGITSVYIPYEEIKHILLKESPISHLIDN